MAGQLLFQSGELIPTVLQVQRRLLLGCVRRGDLHVVRAGLRGVGHDERGPGGGVQVGLVRPGTLQVADRVELAARDLSEKFLTLQRFGGAAGVQKRGQGPEHRTLPEGRRCERRGLRS